jgi:hypothetical protein
MSDPRDKPCVEAAADRLCDAGWFGIGEWLRNNPAEPRRALAMLEDALARSRSYGHTPAEAVALSTLKNMVATVETDAATESIANVARLILRAGWPDYAERLSNGESPLNIAACFAFATRHHRCEAEAAALKAVNALACLQGERQPGLGILRAAERCARTLSRLDVKDAIHAGEVTREEIVETFATALREAT